MRSRQSPVPCPARCSRRPAPPWQPPPPGPTLPSLWPPEPCPGGLSSPRVAWRPKRCSPWTRQRRGRLRAPPTGRAEPNPFTGGGTPPWGTRQPTQSTCRLCPLGLSPITSWGQLDGCASAQTAVSMELRAPRDRSATPPGPSQPRPGPPASEGRPGAWHWAEAAGPSGLSLLQRRGPAFHGLGGSRSPQGGEVLHAAGLCRVPAHLRIWPRQCDPQRFTPIRTRASGPHHRQPAAGSGLRGADRCSYPGHPAPQPPGLRQLLPRGLTALRPVSGRRGHGRHVPAPVTRALPGTGGPKQRGGCPAHVTGTPRQGGGEGTTRDSPRTPAAPKRSKRPPRGVRVAGLQPARARPRPLPVPGGKRSPAEGVRAPAPGPSCPPLRGPSQSGPDLTARHRAVSWRWGPGPQEEPTPATRLPAAGSHAALSPPGLRGPQSHSDGAVTGPAAHRGKPCRA